MDEHVVGRERTLVYVEVKPWVVEDEVGRGIADLDGNYARWVQRRANFKSREKKGYDRIIVNWQEKVSHEMVALKPKACSGEDTHSVLVTGLSRNEDEYPIDSGEAKKVKLHGLVADSAKFEEEAIRERVLRAPAFRTRNERANLVFSFRRSVSKDMIRILEAPTLEMRNVTISVTKV